MNELEKRFFQTYEVFMAMPESPSVEMKVGRRITSFSTTYDAAKQVVDQMTDEERGALLIDFYHAGGTFDLVEALDVGEPLTGKDIINIIIADAIAQQLRLVPEVDEREISNMRMHDTWVYGDNYEA